MAFRYVFAHLGPCHTDRFTQLANVATYNIDHSEGYVYTGGTFQYKDHEHGVILNVSQMRVVYRRPNLTILPQAAFKLSTHYPIIDRYSVVLTTSTGAIQLWNQEAIAWTREEGLSHIQKTRFVELPERKVEVANVVLHNEDLVSRLTRHVGELKVRPVVFSPFRALIALPAIGAAQLPGPIRATIHQWHLCSSTIIRPSHQGLVVPRSIRVQEARYRRYQFRKTVRHRFCSRQYRLVHTPRSKPRKDR
jgi:hypothetical protein